MVDYSADFDLMDGDQDGVITPAEAASNATLSAEFEILDSNNDGKLGKAELAGWSQ